MLRYYIRNERLDYMINNLILFIMQALHFIYILYYKLYLYFHGILLSFIITLHFNTTNHVYAECTNLPGTTLLIFKYDLIGCNEQ